MTTRTRATISTTESPITSVQEVMNDVVENLRDIKSSNNTVNGGITFAITIKEKAILQCTTVPRCTSTPIHAAITAKITIETIKQWTTTSDIVTIGRLITTEALKVGITTTIEPQIDITETTIIASKREVVNGKKEVTKATIS